MRASRTPPDCRARSSWPDCAVSRVASRSVSARPCRLVAVSPVSRRRKPKKKTRTPQPSEPLLFDISEPCICPACTGERPAAAVIVDAFMTRARDLPLAADPLEAEMVGSMILGVPAIDRDNVDLLMVDLLIPNIEERGTAVALALLLALASVAEDEVAAPAGAAAHRLVAHRDPATALGRRARRARHLHRAPPPGASRSRDGPAGL